MRTNLLNVVEVEHGADLNIEKSLQVHVDDAPVGDDPHIEVVVGPAYKEEFQQISAQSEPISPVTAPSLAESNPACVK